MMEIQQHPQPIVYKTVLRNLQKTQPYCYLVPSYYKKQLGYPQQCIHNQSDFSHLTQMLSIDCEMLYTEKGEEICRIVIVNQQYQTVYNQWFLPKAPVINYLTNITAITKDMLYNNAIKTYDQDSKQEIMKLIKNKIIVGHDLANDLQLLNIEHHAFIDTVHLCPHNFGLPYKNKLKNLAMEILRKPIQWTHHDPTQDAIATLQIAKKHISLGKGTVQQVSMKLKQPQQYKDIWEIIQQAELDKNKIVGLFLRGSRALGLEMDVQGYKSDWDYVCVYDTTAKINAKLIKLTQIDITIFDIDTFNFYIHNQNDISYLELFYFPQKFQIINKFKVPQIRIQKLRESLGFHLSKAKMKIQRFKCDPSKRWKILKSVHMKIRFMDNFIQFYDYGMIKDVKRMNFLWEQFKQQYIRSGHFEYTWRKCEAKAKQHMQIVRQKYQNRRKLGNLDHYDENEKKKISLNNIQIINGKYNLVNENNFQQMQQDSSINIKLKPNLQHSKLHLVQQIRQNGFNNLDKYQILMKRATKYPNLIQFKYMQSASFKNPICNEARGIILDQNRNYQVVALPYYKFFDYNDTKYSQLKQFDFNNYKIYQKFDGSIAFIYYYANQWQVASASVPDGQSDYCFARKQTTIEFRKQFWRIFNQSKYLIPNNQDQNKTFVFQLMSTNHIIVCQRQLDNLVLHGVRNIDTLLEEDPIKYQEKYHWKVSKPIILQIKNIQNPIPQIVSITQKLNPLKQQGFILCDNKFTRLKIKNSDYLRISWLGELNLTKNKDPSKYILINIVLAGQADTFSQYCPQWKHVIDQFCLKIQKLNEYVLEQYQGIKGLQKKQFARQVKKKDEKIQYILFELKRNYELYKGRVEATMQAKKFYKLIQQIQFKK